LRELLVSEALTLDCTQYSGGRNRMQTTPL
jgi:hypothetical protein